MEQITGHVECYWLQEIGCFKGGRILSVTWNRLRADGYCQLQEIGCVKSGWILSVTWNRLLQERTDIINYRKSVASRADGYLWHQVFFSTLVYSWRAPLSKVLTIMRSPEICLMLSNRYFITVAWWIKSVNAKLLMPINARFVLSSSLGLSPVCDASAFRFPFKTFSSHTFILHASLIVLSSCHRRRHI
jgi:hypothetical protein